MKQSSKRKEQPVIEIKREDGSVIRFRKLLNAKAVCTLLSISRSTLDRHIKEGKIMTPTFNLGKSPRWSDVMLIDWLQTFRHTNLN
jgi:predicted DNA-binding transcriptional regulator AlpA